MSEKLFRFRCPACGDVLSASTDMIGAEIKCANCATRLEVPAPAKPRSTPTDEEESSGKTRRSDDAIADETPVKFGNRGPLEEDEMDLTPMVDVTFLLLIFFMVTASFSLQKTLETPAPRNDSASAQSRTMDELLDDPDYVVVRIDSYNTFFVTCAAWGDEREAPSRQELLVQIQEARNSNPASPPGTLLVNAHVNALHEKVVAALDAGNTVGMNQVKLLTTEEE
ncbi:biopolymer transporter ExbD [Blastopirellula sp. JC732]|uniref:Biopolymer transporter ExbD n=1 Tax=Blastopirellula sediminis TaxID=2894196 RepID=A0A9X1SN16_9BACT|nr:biopolymer transporter ExbD [Blastopirellula sediminis]MCC9604437.1 biopolymer transporter ExbD [Blastopirellula sediminis]MCC9632264.1 biopolymer transporter ExbD [Blastopirellula sediminis]